MTTISAATKPHYAGGGGRCGGDGCPLENTWPLHNVRHRSVFRRLCTSCVLKYHPGFFCTACFDLFEGSNSKPSGTVRHCSGCSSLCHTSCLPAPDREAKYLCPVCSSSAGADSFSYFSVASSRKEGKAAIDLASAKVFVAATRIAVASMDRAAATSRVEAERKVKEAAVAKKRAREMLERALLVTNKTARMSSRRVLDPLLPEVKPETGAKLASQKRFHQSREREKVTKFHEAIPLAQVMPDQTVDRKGSLVTNCVSGPRNQENKEKNAGIFGDSQSRNTEKNQQSGKLKGMHIPNNASQVPSSS